MKNFWEAFSQSHIVTGLIALLLIGTLCYLLIMERAIPEVLVSLISIIFGYYFGAKMTTLRGK